MDNLLASLYDNQGEYEIAESTFLDCLVERELVLGAEYPDNTICTRKKLEIIVRGKM